MDRPTRPVVDPDLAISIALLDPWLAHTVFAWYPESIRNMATLDATGNTPATWVLVIGFAVALALNGVLGPVAEELYFRGHLLPRIDRLGRAAPVLNTVLFSLYHFWSPWQNLVRVVGLLPWVYVVWRKRSVQLSIAVHGTANTSSCCCSCLRSFDGFGNWRPDW